MSQHIAVKPLMLEWAIERAGPKGFAYAEKDTNIKKWISGEKMPTLKQLEEFSKKVYLPFGYLLLNEPPEEQ